MGDKFDGLVETESDTSSSDGGSAVVAPGSSENSSLSDTTPIKPIQAAPIWTAHGTLALTNHPGFELNYIKPSTWRETTGHVVVETQDENLAQNMADAFVGQFSPSLIAHLKYELNQYLIDLLMEEREGHQRTTKLAPEKVDNVRNLLKTLNTLTCEDDSTYSKDSISIQTLERERCCAGNAVQREAAQNKLKTLLYQNIFKALANNYRETANVGTPGGRLSTRLHNCLAMIREHDFPESLTKQDQGILSTQNKEAGKQETYTIASRDVTDGTHKQLKRFAVALTAFSGANYLAQATTNNDDEHDRNLRAIIQTNSRRLRQFNKVSKAGRLAKATKLAEKTIDTAAIKPNEFRIRLLDTIDSNQKSFIKRFGISTAEFLIGSAGMLADLLTEPFRYVIQEAKDFSRSDPWYFTLGSRNQTVEAPVASSVSVSDPLVGQDEVKATSQVGIKNGFIIAPHSRYLAHNTSFVLPSLYYYLQGVTYRSVDLGNTSPVKMTVAISASAAFMAVSAQYQMGDLIVNELLKKLHQFQFTGNLLGLTTASKLAILVCDVLTQPDKNKVVEIKGWFENQPFTAVLTLVGSVATVVGVQLGHIPHTLRDGFVEINADFGSAIYVGEAYSARLNPYSGAVNFTGESSTQSVRRTTLITQRVETLPNQLIRAPLQIIMPFIRLAASLFIGDPKREFYNLIKQGLGAITFVSKVLLKVVPTIVFTLGTLLMLLPRAAMVVTSKIVGSFSREPATNTAESTNQSHKTPFETAQKLSKRSRLNARNVADSIATAHVKLYEFNIRFYETVNHYLYALPYGYIEKGLDDLSSKIRPEVVTKMAISDKIKAPGKTPTLSFTLEETAREALLSKPNPQSVAFAYNNTRTDQSNSGADLTSANTASPKVPVTDSRLSSLSNH